MYIYHVVQISPSDQKTTKKNWLYSFKSWVKKKTQSPKWTTKNKLKSLWYMSCTVHWSKLTELNRFTESRTVCVKTVRMRFSFRSNCDRMFYSWIVRCVRFVLWYAASALASVVASTTFKWLLNRSVCWAHRISFRLWPRDEQVRKCSTTPVVTCTKRT